MQPTLQPLHKDIISVRKISFFLLFVLSLLQLAAYDDCRYDVFKHFAYRHTCMHAYRHSSMCGEWLLLCLDACPLSLEDFIAEPRVMGQSFITFVDVTG